MRKINVKGQLVEGYSGINRRTDTTDRITFLAHALSVIIILTSSYGAAEPTRGSL